MRKIIALWLALAMVLGCMGLAACNGAGENGVGELEEVLARGADIASLHYDTVITEPDSSPETVEVWLEGDKIRTETDDPALAASGMIVDFATGVQYTFTPGMEAVYRTTYEGPVVTIITQTQSLPYYELSILDTETMDGKECLVIEFDDGEAMIKMWLWKEHGLPVRTERTTDEGLIVYEFKNMDFSDIPDDTFEIPPGIEIIDMDSQIPGLDL